MNRFSIKHGLYVAALVAAVIVPAARVASAGHQQTDYVTVNTTSRFAYGSLGGAYSSPDYQQYIGCQAYAFAGGQAYANCVAVDATGVSSWCSTTDAKLVAIATGIDADDWVRFTWETNGQCSQISLAHYSIFTPKQ